MRPIRSNRIASSPPGNNVLRWLRSLRGLGTCGLDSRGLSRTQVLGADLALRFLDIEMGGTFWLLLSRAVAIVHPDRGAVGPRLLIGESCGSSSCQRPCHEPADLARLGLRPQGPGGRGVGAVHRAVDRPAASLLGRQHRLHHRPAVRRRDPLEGHLSRLRHRAGRHRGGDPGAKPRQRTRAAHPRHRALGRRLPLCLAARSHAQRATC